MSFRFLYAGLALCLAMPAVGQQQKTKPGFSNVQAAKLVSALRIENGLPPVSADSALQRAAQTQANAMAASGSMSHDVAGSLGPRLDAAKIKLRAATENIGAGQKSLDEVFGLWRNSSSHRANMLNPAMRRVGVAVSHNPNSPYGNYWAMVLTD